VGRGEVDEADGEDSRARVRTGNNRNNNSKGWQHTCLARDSFFRIRKSTTITIPSSILSDQDEGR
jgi:hypothetical protein